MFVFDTFVNVMFWVIICATLIIVSILFDNNEQS